MGTPDISGSLAKWFISLERFNKGTPISNSLILDLTSDINYFNWNDRIGFLQHDEKFGQIPKPIVMTMAIDFIYRDVTT